MLTCYRIVAAPVLLVLIIAGFIEVFKWLLALSFLTDAFDGFLARKLKNESDWGARLDSIGDDLTFAVAVTGLAITRPAFIMQEWLIVAVLLALFLLQLLLALKKYGRLTSFHTYLAKIAALLQASFLLSAFFFEEIYYPLFYAACAVTVLDLLEEIALVLILPEWRANVRGLYWVRKNVRQQESETQKSFL